MASGWRKARNALGLHICISPQREPEEHQENVAATSPGTSPAPSSRSGTARSPSRLQLLRNSIRLSRSTCSICLEVMKPGTGHALFTAECSHTFHFSCIASSVRHGNLVCPVCRAQWKEVPWQAPASPKLSPRTPRRGLSRQQQEDELQRLDPVLRILDESIATARGFRRSNSVDLHVYDDDEPVNENLLEEEHVTTGGEKLELTCHSEVSNVCFSEARSDFTVLVHVKALPSSPSSSLRAPIDLVTVLDVSGSMAGTKLTLLKQAMSFVIRNLSTSDRLAIVAFSSTAKRLFPLRRMIEEGKQQALRAVDALVSSGGTNIAEGLRKCSKILEDRRHRNPIASIMLLSDGQDTHGTRLSRGASFRRERAFNAYPVHTFGFGADHDASTMHAIAESSSGTFSFIQAEAAVQDAFAQCIGGLLSVVVQDAELRLAVASECVRLGSIQAGSYEQSVTEQGACAVVKLGDLYAEEERDVLLQTVIPSVESPTLEFNILEVKCFFKDPVSRKVSGTTPSTLSIGRPESVDERNGERNTQVDRQKSRVHTAETILEAGQLADRGDLAGAQQTIQGAKAALHASGSVSGDRLLSALEEELTQIQVRMANRQLYETSGRAYVLSSQSSHFRQRATARGDSVESQSRDYQTPSMVDMVMRSQSLTFPGMDRALSSNRSSRRASGRVHDVESSM